jgi:hypothetical protein
MKYVRKSESSLGARQCISSQYRGWGQEQDRHRSAEAGFDHHLVKPVHSEILMKVLDSIRTSRLINTESSPTLPRFEQLKTRIVILLVRPSSSLSTLPILCWKKIDVKTNPFAFIRTNPTHPKQNLALSAMLSLHGRHTRQIWPTGTRTHSDTV